MTKMSSVMIVKCPVRVEGDEEDDMPVINTIAARGHVRPQGVIGRLGVKAPAFQEASPVQAGPSQVG
jgi:hypothetical protein